MAYEVINEKLKVEACRLGDLTMNQVESFLKLWGDGEKIETLTLFLKQDGTVVLNRDNKNHQYFKEIAESYLGLDEESRKKMEIPEGARETLRVLDRAIEQRKITEVCEMLKHSVINFQKYDFVRKIFMKYESSEIAMYQAYCYGVIEGKRVERAKKRSA